MDGILIHGKRYLFMIVFHSSHGQIIINRIYLPMDIGDIHKYIGDIYGSSTKSMKKQSNIDTVISHFLILFSYQLTSIETIQITSATNYMNVIIVRYRRPLFLLIC